MFRERKFRFNVWILGAGMTVGVAVVTYLLPLTGRWHTHVWNDPFLAVMTLAAIWLVSGIVWGLFPVYAGAEGLSATDGIGRYHDVRWENIRGVTTLPGFFWIQHGKLGKALCFPKFLEDQRGFRETVVRYAPEENPLRAALEGRRSHARSS